MLKEQESIVAIGMALAAVRQACDTFSQSYDALNEAEQLIFHHKDAFGARNSKFQQGCEEFVLLCNTIAMQQLHSATDGDEMHRCGTLLMRAEQHTRRAGYLCSLEHEHVSSRVALRLVCLNNLACFNKQIEKPLVAVRFLEQALQIQLKQAQEQMQDVEANVAEIDANAFTDNAIALTHLNLCVVLSQMRRHEAAAEHARLAIQLLAVGQVNALDVDSNMLVIAHYNLAVELEHLQDVQHASLACEQGIAVANAAGWSSETHEVTRLLEDMKRTQRSTIALGKTLRSARSLSPRKRVGQRPSSPRTLRQMG